MNLLNKENKYFIVFPRGGEEIISQILQKMNLPVIESATTFIVFEADLADFYGLLVKCPFASRMGRMLALDTSANKNTSVEDRLQALDSLVGTIAWNEICGNSAVKISVKASSGLQIHEKYTAKRISQFISRQFFSSDSQPSTGSTLYIRIIITEERIVFGLDAAESILYQRLSPARAKAALKEHLAALIGAYGFSNYDDITMLVDPVCGSGTLLLESLAEISGIHRPVPRGLVIEHWPDFDQQLWCRTLDSINQPLTPSDIRGVGFDASQSALRAAQANAEVFKKWNLAGRQCKVHLERRDLIQDWPQPQAGRAAIVMNPPYGKRLGSGQNMAFLYQAIGRQLQLYANTLIEKGSLPPVYTIISSDIELLDCLRLSYDKQVRLYNGADPIFLRAGIIEQKDIPQRQPLKPSIVQLDRVTDDALFVQDLAQRLIKNYKKINAFLKSPVPKVTRGLPADVAALIPANTEIANSSEIEPLRLFRLYNADIPEYNCAIDVYEHCVYVQEYKAPSKVDPKKAAHRIEQVKHTLAQVMQLPPQRILMKSRERQTGKQQYKRLNADTKNLGPLENWHRKKHVFCMQEWGAQFIVNLADYIDTGLFLDHRKLRWLIHTISAQKHVLNLFSYTGSFSIHAALGGAASTTSVDLSPRYTAWTEHNFMANGLGLDRNEVIRADVITWLQSHSNQYDLIVIDPPTFSNSKKADDFLVQEDHETLIRQAMRHLQGQGMLFFSCNMKKFSFAENLSQDYQVDEISSWTQSPDFQSKTGSNLSGGHRCWVLRHRR